MPNQRAWRVFKRLNKKSLGKGASIITQASSYSESHCWHILSDVDFLQHRWDHDLVVYNAGSGDTHILESITAEIFQFLKENTANLSRIIEHVADTFNYEIDSGLESHISELIEQLQKTGLIESKEL